MGVSVILILVVGLGVLGLIVLTVVALAAGSSKRRERDGGK